MLSLLTKAINTFLMIFCLFCFSACQQENFSTEKSSTLRISCESDPQTLDPRLVRDLGTTTVIHLLYEGLMRSQGQEQPTYAIAKNVIISDDQKTYTFTLRDTAWSNGQPVTAYDFEETWKSILDPEFAGPNAYQFYCIQGAQAAKEGKVSKDQIGIQAKDDKTLIVQLENPVPYFIHLTATYFYYPVHSSLRQTTNESKIITNGPFQLEKWDRHNELNAIPNLHYWDHDHVRLNHISFVLLDNPTALQLFKNNELEWTGSPLSTLSVDALASLKQANQLHSIPGAGVYLFRLNTEKPPLDQIKVRQALALAINRQELVDHVLQGNQLPALGLIPPSFMKNEPLFKDHDLTKALQLFQECLNENGWTLKNFPKVAIQYAANERSHKIAQVVQQQWKENLGIEAELQSIEAKVYYDQLKNHQYQIGIGSWFADFHDPISFLEIFKLKNNGTNNTQWENAGYINLLNQSTFASKSADRKKILQAAEKLIIEEMPIIPLFYSSYNYLHQPTVKDVYFSDLGYLDFKNTYLESNIKGK